MLYISRKKDKLTGFKQINGYDNPFYKHKPLKDCLFYVAFYYIIYFTKLFPLYHNTFIP